MLKVDVERRGSLQNDPLTSLNGSMSSKPSSVPIAAQNSTIGLADGVKGSP